MDSLLESLRSQTVAHIENGLTDSDGNQKIHVEKVYTGDEFEITEYVSENERNVARIPHAFVWVGTVNFQGSDSSRELFRVQIPVRTFLATRDDSVQGQNAQYEIGSKWAMFIIAALAGQRFGTDSTDRQVLDSPTVESIVNTERLALWEVRFTLQLNVETTHILDQLK